MLRNFQIAKTKAVPEKMMMVEAAAVMMVLVVKYMMSVMMMNAKVHVSGIGATGFYTS